MEKTIDERGIAKLWGKVKEYVEREGDSGSHTHDDRYYTEEEIDGKMKAQQDQIDTMKNNTADVFDETKTYAVGNYCIYNNVLYKCKTAVTEAGLWNEDNWAITTVEAEISELNSNKIDNSDIVVSSLMNSHEGSFCYIKIGKMVFIYLSINVTTGGQYGHIPEGFRPGYDMHFPIQRTGSLEVGHAKVSSSGGLHIEQFSNSGWHTGCVFYGAAS